MQYTIYATLHWKTDGYVYVTWHKDYLRKFHTWDQPYVQEANHYSQILNSAKEHEKKPNGRTFFSQIKTNTINLM